MRTPKEWGQPCPHPACAHKSRMQQGNVHARHVSPPKRHAPPLRCPTGATHVATTRETVFFALCTAEEKVMGAPRGSLSGLIGPASAVGSGAWPRTPARPTGCARRRTRAAACRGTTGAVVQQRSGVSAQARRLRGATHLLPRLDIDPHGGGSGGGYPVFFPRGLPW